MALPDPELCDRYARFASHLSRAHFKIIYWLLFLLNLFLLFLGSWTFTKAQDVLHKSNWPENQRARRLRSHILMCLGCVLTSVVVVVMEAFALLALEFCDGEDLMSLYWSTWTMIQVGALIAMVGIILALMHSLRNRRHPPWALALGTPVLVIAGLLHLLHDCTRKRVKKWRRKSQSVEAEDETSMSRVNTIQANQDDEEADMAMQGELVGFTIHGGPIVRFNEPSQGYTPEHAELLGHDEEKRAIVTWRKDVIRFETAEEAAAEAEEEEKNPKKPGERAPASA